MQPEFAIEAVPILWKVLCAVVTVLITILIAIGKLVSNDIRGLNSALTQLTLTFQKEISDAKVIFRQELSDAKDELHDRVTRNELDIATMKTVCQMSHGTKFGSRSTDNVGG